MGGVGRAGGRNGDGVEVERVRNDVGKERSCAQKRACWWRHRGLGGLMRGSGEVALLL